MSDIVATAIERVAQSERVRVAVLACATGALAMLFLALLVADHVEAAGL